MTTESTLANMMRLQAAFIKAAGYDIKASVIEGKQGEYDYACTKKVKVNRASYADDYTPEFLEAWQVYPKLSGNSKRHSFRCFQARLKEGVDAKDMIAGVNRYAAFIKATDRFVQLGSTFFGPDQHFNDDWDLPTVRLQLPKVKEELEEFAKEHGLSKPSRTQTYGEYRKTLTFELTKINKKG